MACCRVSDGENRPWRPTFLSELPAIDNDGTLYGLANNGTIYALEP